MTLLGYGEEIRRRRIEKFSECDMLWNSKSINGHLITVGSKTEGLTCWRESDYDH
ncbi:hypothetical protein DPMN_040641 [Dreissena polymorpha]|uniref:Uncharacterized protein n=1 Tax=Dreissena polymorpha TaxID=45954 RepID=A0A9D4HX44_DREPO|nr:hypothetical protein DPMN_040641 [Dreissena polymorpha]